MSEERHHHHHHHRREEEYGGYSETPYNAYGGGYAPNGYGYQTYPMPTGGGYDSGVYQRAGDNPDYPIGFQAPAVFQPSGYAVEQQRYEEYERERKEHKHKEHQGELGALAAGAFALYERHEEKKDPEHARRHKIEEGLAEAAAAGAGGYALYEHHESNKYKNEEEYGEGRKHHHRFF